MPHRFGQVYARRVKFTTGVSIFLVFPITDTISGKHANISSCADFDSHLNMIFQLSTLKENEVAIHYVISCLVYIFPSNIVFLFSLLTSIPFPSLSQLSCQIQVGRQ